MENPLTITRRNAIALGMLGAGFVIGLDKLTPKRTRVYESTMRSPRHRSRANPPPIVDGEPPLDSPMPTVRAFVFQTTEEAERRMDWDALLPPEASKPFREIGFGAFTTVVVAVLPVSMELMDTPNHSIRGDAVHHTVGVRDRSDSLTLSMDEDAPAHHYMLNKWEHSVLDTPSRASARLEGSL